MFQQRLVPVATYIYRVIFHVQAGLATANQSQSPWKLPPHVFPRWTPFDTTARWPMADGGAAAPQLEFDSDCYSAFLLSTTTTTTCFVLRSQL